MRIPDIEERVRATREPGATAFMRQNWHHLLFLHWEISPNDLQGLLPAGLDLDTFEGKAFVGLIPFTMTGVRPVFTPPLPWASSFHEVNVRTYVHRGGRDPGVWFFSLDASSTLAVSTARGAYKLPYFYSEIEMRASDDPLPSIDFQSDRNDSRGVMPAHSHILYRPLEGSVQAAAPGTLDFFLVERYVLYAVDENRQLHRARVHHQPYLLQPAEVSELEETLVWAAGIRRSQDAPIRHYARGVNVKVYVLEKV